jgi:spore coat protein SA
MIYHLLDEAEPFSEFAGGAISRWAANVLRDGDEVVVCPSADRSWGYPENRVRTLNHWEKTKYPIHAVLYRLPWTLQKRAYRAVLSELMEQLSPGDVLYIHNRPECAGPLAEIAERRGIRLVLHMHNSLLLRANRGQIASLKRVPLVFCSEFLRDEAMQAYPDHFQRTYRVYNGADHDKFFAEPKSIDESRSQSGDAAVPTILFSGRIVPIKGVHVLLEAMRLLEQRRVKARCRIAGAAGFGSARRSRYLRRLEHNRPTNTEFVGYLGGEKLAEALRKADVYCAPSVWNDPFPLAPLEAMASGLPVVASRAGGIPEALAFGGGILVDQNDPVALADVLEELVRDPALRSRLGEEAVRALHGHFLWSHVRQQYNHVIQEISQ